MVAPHGSVVFFLMRWMGTFSVLVEDCVEERVTGVVVGCASDKALPCIPECRSVADRGRFPIGHVASCHLCTLVMILDIVASEKSVKDLAP